jgi:hypothetical protein
VLEHVVEAQILDLVLGGVDLLIRVLKLRFDDESRGITESAGRGVVGAGVTALGLDVGDIAVLELEC